MWISTVHGFFSIVCATDPKTRQPMPDLLMVRARRKEHLESLRKEMMGTDGHDPDFKIVTNTGTDYPFRVLLPKNAVLEIINIIVEEIDYSNFKSEVQRKRPADHKYVHALHEMWGVGRRMEDNDLIPKYDLVRRDPLKRVDRRSKSQYFKKEKAMTEKNNTGPLVEDTTVVGGRDIHTGAPVIKPKTPEGRADESVNPTDAREAAKK